LDVAMRLHTVGRLSGDERGPLLVVLDGPDYVRRASLLRLLRRLVDEERVPAHRVAVIRPEDRVETYSACLPYARALTAALTSSPSGDGVAGSVSARASAGLRFSTRTGSSRAPSRGSSSSRGATFAAEPTRRKNVSLASPASTGSSAPC
jgi:hypothetical protein